MIGLPREHKDISALYLADEAAFVQRWQLAKLTAVPWSAAEQGAAAETWAAAWLECADLAQRPAILDELDAELNSLGMVGERRNAKILYLALTSRVFERPVSVAVKGPSSGGKSHLVETVLRLFPEAAAHTLTALSERALAYSREPLKHRHLVIFEADGLASDFATYLVRSLLSEGRICDETVEKTPKGLEPKLIEREGPTGLIVTTTRIRLHPENETRLLSLNVTDTPAQTKAVFHALANGARSAADITRWHAIQTWLASGATNVVIPFASVLADLVPPVAVRLRRDFGALLTLIRVHALLHQASRPADEAGRIVAIVEDYAIVRQLVADLLADEVEVSVPAHVREIVEAVRAILAARETLPDDSSGVSQAEIAKRLDLDKAAISRRVRAACEHGFLNDCETRKGRSSRLLLGDPLPSEVELLPEPETVDRLSGCERDTCSPLPVFRTNGASLPICDECGRPEDDLRDPLMTLNLGARQVCVHRRCNRQKPNGGGI